MPHWLRWSLGSALVILVGVFAAGRLARLLGLILTGAVLAYLLSGIVLRLERHMPPGWAAAAAVGGLLCAVMTLITLLAPLIAEQLRELALQLPRILAQLRAWAAAAQQILGGILPADPTVFLPDLSSLAGRLTQLTAGAAMGSLAAVSYLLAPLFAFYFLKDRALFGEWIGYLIPMAYRDGVTRIIADIHRELQHYLRGQLVVSAAVGALTALGLLILGIDAWLVMGIVMAVCNMVPFFGPWLGAAPILLVSLLQGGRTFLFSAGLVLAVQQADSLILSPRIVGDSLQLHPLAVICTVLAGSALLGPAGLLLSIPAVIVLRAVCRHLFLRRMPPSTPIPD